MPGSILRTTRRRASDAADGYPDREHPGSSSPLRDAAHGRAIALDAALRLRHRVRREPKGKPYNVDFGARRVRSRPTDKPRAEAGSASRLRGRSRESIMKRIGAFFIATWTAAALLYLGRHSVPMIAMSGVVAFAGFDLLRP
ncbi:hypothetical protein [Burkholderia pseudomallei]|nr:hypothetical protein [Burkholderia pseudomallei]